MQERTALPDIEKALNTVRELCNKALEEDHETQRDLYSRAVDILEPLVTEYHELMIAEHG